MCGCGISVAAAQYMVVAPGIEPGGLAPGHSTGGALIGPTVVRLRNIRGSRTIYGESHPFFGRCEIAHQRGPHGHTGPYRNRYTMHAAGGGRILYLLSPWLKATKWWWGPGMILT